MPMEPWRYQDDWEKRARQVKEAARWRCRRCGKKCPKPGEPFDTRRRTLTAAHVDHDPENEDARLTALCVPRHLRYDNKARASRNAAEQLRILYLWNGWAGVSPKDCGIPSSVMTRRHTGA